MRFFNWIRKTIIFSLLTSAWLSLKERISLWLNPLKRYETELTALLLAREEISELYETLKKGSSAAELVQLFEEMAANEKISKEQSARANLLLSVIYQEGIAVDSFVLVKDEKKAADYQQKAIAYLGPELVLSEKSKKFIECIKLGGEPQYAFQKLLFFAKSTTESPKSTWSNNILSFLYRKGFWGESFKLAPDSIKANFYHQHASQGLQKLEARLNHITTKLMAFRFNKKNAFALIKKIADSGNKFAKYVYAQYLTNTSSSPKESFPYYYQAAEKSKQTPFSLKASGNNDAKKYLISLLEKQNPSTEAVQKSKQFRFEMALDEKEPLSQNYAKAMIASAKKGDTIDCLQTGLYYLAKSSINAAENYFNQASEIEKSLSPYEMKLYEKLAVKLAACFEEQFINCPTSLTFNLTPAAKQYLEKVIFYLQKIPASSSQYQEAQFKIAHFQKYFLQDCRLTKAAFKKLSDQGDQDSAYMWVISSFKNYWDKNKSKLSPSELKTVFNYEAKNKGIFEQLKIAAQQVDFENRTGIVELLKALVLQIEQYNEKIIQSNVTPIIAVDELKILLEKFAEQRNTEMINYHARLKAIFDFGSHFNPELKEKFDLLKTSSVHTTGFFVPNKIRNQEKYEQILNVYLKCAWAMARKQEKYYTLIEKSFFNYLAKTCLKILSTELNTDTNGLNQLQHAGVIINAK